MKYANQHGYSDITPFEVIREVSSQTLDVRGMKAERDESVELEFHIGGFAAHCSNQHAQRWHITSDTTERTVRIRKNKLGQWHDASGRRFVLSDTPVHFYDYNF